MLHALTPEHTLSLTVGVPPEVNAHEFDQIVSLAADLDVGSYLLEPGSEVRGQLDIARELSRDDELPDVIYDGRNADLNIRHISSLVASGVSSVIVGGRQSTMQRNLRSAGLGVIQQPHAPTNLKVDLLDEVREAFRAAGDPNNRRRLYISKGLSVAAVADCVSWVINRDANPVHRISVYMEDGVDAQRMRQMFVAESHVLRLHERILVAPAETDSTAVEVVRAVQDAQERFLKAA